MNNALFLVLCFQCVFAQILESNNEETQDIQEKTGSLLDAGAVIISSIMDQLQVIQAPTQLESESAIISIANETVQEIQAPSANATNEAESAILSSVIDPIQEIQAPNEAESALISNVFEPIEEIQNQAPAEAIFEAGTAIISDDQIHQIQAEADAMFHNQTIFPFPSTVKATKLFIAVYSRADRNGTRIPITAAGQIYSLTSFSPLLHTIICIFGWNSANKSEIVVVKDGILNRTDANVLILDWSFYSQTLSYFDAHKAVEKTGQYLGQVLAQLIKIYPIYKILLLGHSLGAHIAGFAGRWIGGMLPVILGLDPAGIFYYQHEPSKRLNTGDAKHVMVLHTSYVGIQFSSGHSDFWANGGVFQKGCTRLMCSHVRALYLYVDSLGDKIYGTKCQHFWMYMLGFCKFNERKKMGGIHVDISAKGDYSFCTNSEPPY